MKEDLVLTSHIFLLKKYDINIYSIIINTDELNEKINRLVNGVFLVETTKLIILHFI